MHSENQDLAKLQVARLQGSYGILNTFFKDFPKKCIGPFMSFSRTFHNCKKLKKKKGSSNTAGSLDLTCTWKKHAIKTEGKNNLTWVKVRQNVELKVNNSTWPFFAE